MNQVQALQKQLQNVLEKESLAPQSNSSSKQFEPQRDLSQLDFLGVKLPSSEQARVETLFGRIAPFFESGLLFKKQKSPTTWTTWFGFDQGSIYPLSQIDLGVHFQFPELTLIEVHRVHSKSLFHDLQKIQVAKTDSSQILIFRPHPDYLFLVSSELPDLWLKPLIEEVQKKILMILSDHVEG